MDYKAYTADLFFEYPFADGGVLTATALYLKADFDDAYKTTTSVADLNTIVGGLNGQKEGYYAKLGYILPVTVGARGKFQPFARYENWDVASFANVRDQNIQQFGIGANYFVLGDEKVRFTLEYYNTKYDKPTMLGDYLDQTVTHASYTSYNTYTAMFMVVF